MRMRRIIPLIVPIIALSYYWFFVKDTTATAELTSQKASVHNNAVVEGEKSPFSSAKVYNQVPKSQSNSAGIPAGTVASVDRHDDISGYQEYLDEMSMKALPDGEDIAKLKRMANSQRFQKAVFDVLHAKNVSSFSFKEEKLRFKHQSYLYEMFLYGNDSTRQYMLNELKSQIFSDSFLRQKDLKLRQSLAGDKVDYIRFIKKRFPEEFKDVEQRILESDSELLKYCLAKA